MHCNTTIIDTPDLTQWIDQEPRLKLPITKATLEKAVRLGAEHAKRLNEAEADRIKKQGKSMREKQFFLYFFEFSNLKKFNDIFSYILLILHVSDVNIQEGMVTEIVVEIWQFMHIQI